MGFFVFSITVEFRSAVDKNPTPQGKRHPHLPLINPSLSYWRPHSISSAGQFLLRRPCSLRGEHRALAPLHLRPLLRRRRRRLGDAQLLQWNLYEEYVLISLRGLAPRQTSRSLAKLFFSSSSVSDASSKCISCRMTHVCLFESYLWPWFIVWTLVIMKSQSFVKNQHYYRLF